MCRLQNAHFIHQSTQCENLANFHPIRHKTISERPRYGLRTIDFFSHFGKSPFFSDTGKKKTSVTRRLALDGGRYNF